MTRFCEKLMTVFTLILLLMQFSANLHALEHDIVDSHIGTHSSEHSCAFISSDSLTMIEVGTPYLDALQNDYSFHLALYSFHYFSQLDWSHHSRAPPRLPS